MTTISRRVTAACLLIAVVLAGLTASHGQALESSTPTAVAVVREVLAGGEPPSAMGKSLQLVRFIIAPGTKLAVHTHPGMQVAWLESGMLEYTVISGEVPITRAGPGLGTPGPVETLAAGQTTTFQPGDSWVEPEGVVHFGENAGSEPVVILVSSLFTIGEPPSLPVATPAA